MNIFGQDLIGAGAVLKIKENEDDAKLYVVGSGPPIQYENTIELKLKILSG